MGQSSVKGRRTEDRMDFRLERDHKALIEKAAAYCGESLTGFAVSTLVAPRAVRHRAALRSS